MSARFVSQLFKVGASFSQNAILGAARWCFIDLGDMVGDNSKYFWPLASNAGHSGTTLLSLFSGRFGFLKRIKKKTFFLKEWNYSRNFLCNVFKQTMNTFLTLILLKCYIGDINNEKWKIYQEICQLDKIIPLKYVTCKGDIIII